MFATNEWVLPCSNLTCTLLLYEMSKTQLTYEMYNFVSSNALDIIIIFLFSASASNIEHVESTYIKHQVTISKIYIFHTSSSSWHCIGSVWTFSIG